MPKIIRKQPLTLIEVCIALGLMAIIVYTLFSSLIQTVRVSKSLDVIKETSLKSSFFYDRLLPIFSHAEANSFKLEEDDNGSITKLSFTFENGLDPALIYSGKTTASIHTGLNHDLILTIFSKDKSMQQNEILLSNVQEFSIEPNLPFFITLQVKLSETSNREFVFFLSDRPENSEAYPV